MGQVEERFLDNAVLSLLWKEDKKFEFKRKEGSGKGSFAVAGIIITASILSERSVPALCDLDARPVPA